MNARPSRKPEINRATRWRDRKGREWRRTRRVEGGLHDCETTDGRFAGLWSTSDIRQAMEGYPAPARTPHDCVCGAAA